MNKTNNTIVLTHVGLPLILLGELLASVFEEALERIHLRMLVVGMEGHHVALLLHAALVDRSLLDHRGDILGGGRVFMPVLAFLAHDGGRGDGRCDFCWC